MNNEAMLKQYMPMKCLRLVAWAILFLLLLYLVDITGVFRHFQERSFESDFSYPLESENFKEIVNAFRLGKNINIPPINNLYHGISIKSEPVQSCDGHEYTLLILVKTSPTNFKQRQAIRETWKPSAEDRNSKVVFFIGGPSMESEDKQEALVKQLMDEINAQKDVVRLAFKDSYYNNTIKTMLEMRWAVEHCSSFRHALLIDDDYYLSVKNLLQFIENPLGYPEKAEKSSSMQKLYAGFRMFPPPHRHKFFTKWFVSLEEYPYDRFPPYVTAGSILLSKNALEDIYYASFYTTHFRFDDIYVAICARKMNITPIHSDYFRFWSTRDESPEEYLIASHGFSNPDKLHRFWRSQKSHGYC